MRVSPVLVAGMLAACSAPAAPPPEEPVANVAAKPAEPDEPERGPVVLFIGIGGGALVPAICSERPGAMSSGTACLALVGESVDVRTPTGRLETARRGSFECGPTEEQYVIYQIDGTSPVFAVSPTGEETARLDTSVEMVGGPGSVATSDIDGDGVREALIGGGGEDSGDYFTVVRVGPGDREVLFEYECRS